MANNTTALSGSHLQASGFAGGLVTLVTAVALKMNTHNKHIRFYINPIRIARHLWQFRNLIWLMGRREIQARYKGSFLGIGLSFLNPLLMLGVYTFVFSFIFKSRWEMDTHGGISSGAVILFAGLVTFTVFADMLQTAPNLVVRNASYVKKVLFPLEILPVINMFSILVNASFSLVILLVGVLIVFHGLHFSILYLPLVWFPLLFFTLGIGYFLSSFGVFVRDLSVIISSVSLMLRFLSPVFYPLSAIPESIRFAWKLNPISYFVENSRRVILWNLPPEWKWTFYILIFSIVFFVLGFNWFLRSKHAFDDVM